jgi:ferredoxin
LLTSDSRRLERADKPALAGVLTSGGEAEACREGPKGRSVLDWLFGRLTLTKGRVVAYVITEACIGTKNTACVQACPVDCIYDAGDHFVINPAECIDCSMCMPECPVEAIYPGDEVPDDMQYYVGRAAEFDYSSTAPGVELN